MLPAFLTASFQRCSSNATPLVHQQLVSFHVSASCRRCCDRRLFSPISTSQVPKRVNSSYFAHDMYENMWKFGDFWPSAGVQPPPPTNNNDNNFHNQRPRLRVQVECKEFYLFFSGLFFPAAPRVVAYSNCHASPIYCSPLEHKMEKSAEKMAKTRAARVGRVHEGQH